jgi:hypothetical protein
VILHEFICDFRCRGTGRGRHRRTDIYRRVVDDSKVTSQAKQLAQHKQRRIKLYNEFIEEASKLFVDALEHETPNPSAMVGLYTTISRMRILSSAVVIECAEKVGDLIVDTYLAPKMTPDELRETLKSRTFHSFDYLRDFSKVCRAERGTDLPQHN